MFGSYVTHKGCFWHCLSEGLVERSSHLKTKNNTLLQKKNTFSNPCRNTCFNLGCRTKFLAPPVTEMSSLGKSSLHSSLKRQRTFSGSVSWAIRINYQKKSRKFEDNIFYGWLHFILLKSALCELRGLRNTFFDNIVVQSWLHLIGQSVSEPVLYLAIKYTTVRDCQFFLVFSKYPAWPYHIIKPVLYCLIKHWP